MIDIFSRSFHVVFDVRIYTYIFIETSGSDPNFKLEPVPVICERKGHLELDLFCSFHRNKY